jgi:hypothetical protein
MARYPPVSPATAERRIGKSTHRHRLRSVRSGLFAALLAVALGVGLGFSGPAAHAAAAVPNASCSISRIATSPTIQLPWGNHNAILWAKYDAAHHWRGIVWGRRKFTSCPAPRMAP